MFHPSFPGISYLTSADEQILMDELAAKYENLSNADAIPKVTVPEELVPFIEDAW